MIFNVFSRTSFSWRESCTTLTSSLKARSREMWRSSNGAKYSNELFFMCTQVNSSNEELQVEFLKRIYHLRHWKQKMIRMYTSTLVIFTIKAQAKSTQHASMTCSERFYVKASRATRLRFSVLKYTRWMQRKDLGEPRKGWWASSAVEWITRGNNPMIYAPSKHAALGHGKLRECRLELKVVRRRGQNWTPKISLPSKRAVPAALFHELQMFHMNSIKKQFRLATHCRDWMEYMLKWQKFRNYHSILLKFAHYTAPLSQNKQLWWCALAWQKSAFRVLCSFRSLVEVRNECFTSGALL